MLLSAEGIHRSGLDTLRDGRFIAAANPLFVLFFGFLQQFGILKQFNSGSRQGLGCKAHDLFSPRRLALHRHLPGVAGGAEGVTGAA